MMHKQCINNALQNKALSYKKTENNQHTKNAHIFRNKPSYIYWHSHIFRLFALEQI